MHRPACLLLFATLLALSHDVIADDAIEFDRPGIAFSTSTLPRGGIAWEQGLPDFSDDRSQGIRTTAWVADTLIRVGVTDSVELQLGADTYGGIRTHGGGVRHSEQGGGDGWASVKWAPSTDSEIFTWALLATRSLPFGSAPIGGGGDDYSLGVTANWALPADTGIALYADRSWGDDGSGWLLSPSYSFPLGNDFSGYVEAGYGTGGARTRVAGGGVTWMASPRLQLDVSFLRGLDRESPDWQGGIGLALYFD
jgi:hypothetical protein